MRGKTVVRGELRVPGDKSISHRALILASQARGTTRISGLSRGGDVKNTARALRRLGVGLAPWGTEPLTVRGAGLGGGPEASFRSVPIDPTASPTWMRSPLSTLFAV